MKINSIYSSFAILISLTFCFYRTSAAGKMSSFPDTYVTSVTFPAAYIVGDYVEFVSVAPIAAGASGNFEISIAYVRGNIAAAATHLAAISHSNADVWRETGRINNNKYVDSHLSFTIDCNTWGGQPRFRVRAIATHGSSDQPLTVQIAVTSRNFNASYHALNISGNNTGISKFLPMTNDWELYVGNLFTPSGASLAIKAAQNGNVGIGTASPDEKLSVNGKIRAHEVKVETTGWPDYVFEEEYKILGLNELERFIKVNKHLPEIPSASIMEKEGVALGEMNKLLLKKVEELTLHLIQKEKELIVQQETNKSLDTRVLQIENHLKLKK